MKAVIRGFAESIWLRCDSTSSTGEMARARTSWAMRQREDRLGTMRFVYGSLVCVVLALAGSRSSVHFTDVTANAGIHFTHHNGAFGKKYLPETMGSGCAFVDTDGSGWPDILLLNGIGISAFYRNNHTVTF